MNGGKTRSNRHWRRESRLERIARGWEHWTARDMGTHLIISAIISCRIGGPRRPAACPAVSSIPFVHSTSAADPVSGVARGSWMIGGVFWLNARTCDCARVNRSSKLSGTTHTVKQAIGAHGQLTAHAWMMLHSSTIDLLSLAMAFS